MAERVTPSEAHARMKDEGFAYLDVRTVPEFEAGHPAGAYNVPFLVDGPSGRAPNPDFLAVVARNFDRARALVVGCHTNARATRAVEALEGAGYTRLALQIAGWAGLKDAFGRTTTPGWQASGLPIATQAEPGHGHAELAS